MMPHQIKLKSTSNDFDFDMYISDLVGTGFGNQQKKNILELGELGKKACELGLKLTFFNQ